MTMRRFWCAALAVVYACTPPDDSAPNGTPDGSIDGAANGPSNGAPADAAGREAEPTARPAYDEPIVLFVEPDSAEIDRMRERLGEDFYAVADDAMWYQAQAYALLDSLGVPHATVGRGAAHFRIDGEARRFSWREFEGAWFVVLYNGADEPRISWPINLPEEIDFVRPWASLPPSPPVRRS